MSASVLITAGLVLCWASILILVGAVAAFLWAAEREDTAAVGVGERRSRGERRRGRSRHGAVGGRPVREVVLAVALVAGSVWALGVLIAEFGEPVSRTLGEMLQAIFGPG